MDVRPFKTIQAVSFVMSQSFDTAVQLPVVFLVLARKNAPVIATRLMLIWCVGDLGGHLLASKHSQNSQLGSVTSCALTET